MKKPFRIIILADNLSRLINRILIVFNRRNLIIKSMNVCQGESPDILHYTIDLECIEDQINQLIKQIEKLIGVSRAFYHRSDTERSSKQIKTSVSL
ncbi:MAG: ACT domain-containing protein [Flavobacteriales bacterium Tduv]